LLKNITTDKKNTRLDDTDNIKKIIGANSAFPFQRKERKPFYSTTEDLRKKTKPPT
jgi:hypothetical protein